MIERLQRGAEPLDVVLPTHLAGLDAAQGVEPTAYVRELLDGLSAEVLTRLLESQDGSTP